tara:strand:+ start:116 stop:274 length:159 start_codon:yes stop_codon:yes gene_type:complete
MVFNTGVFKRNKQTVMNTYFIKNFKKRKKKILNPRSFQYPDLGLGNSAASVI